MGHNPKILKSDDSSYDLIQLGQTTSWLVDVELSVDAAGTSAVASLQAFWQTELRELKFYQSSGWVLVLLSQRLCAAR